MNPEPSGRVRIRAGHAGPAAQAGAEPGLPGPGFSPGDVVPYPGDLVSRYRAAGLWADRTIAQELTATADAYPEHPAVASAGGVLRYRELDQASDRIALGLRDLGLRPGERVLLQLANHAGTVLAWYGLLKAGLVPVATLAQHRRHELAEIARQSQPAAHLFEPGFPGHDLAALAAETAAAQPSIRLALTLGAPQAAGGDAVPVESLLAHPAGPAAAREEVAGIQRALAPTSVAVLQLSGGTTSVPKLIPRLQCEYWYNARCWAAAVRLAPGDCAAHLLPVIHNAGIVCAVHAAHSVGACVAVCAPDPAELATLTGQARITHMMMTRAIVNAIHRDPAISAGLASLRAVTWADRVVPAEVIAEFEAAGATVGQMFGMGEGLCLATPLDAAPAIRHHTQGTRISAYDEVRVLEPGTLRPVAPGERGELCARGPYTIRGYFRAPGRNAQAFTPDGFYRTGDIVTEIRQDGMSYYRLEDRIKDLINRGGEKVNAQEVEELLIRHPAVERAAVVAMPDPRLGERACAFLVARPGARAPGLDEVRVFLDTIGVAKFKWPERIEIRDELPLTNIHKVNKAALRREIRRLTGEGGPA